MARCVVAIVGRSNVGKSTLFNRLNSEEVKKKAIIDATPGVTRDRNYALGEWNGFKFWIVDTGGLEILSADKMLSLMRGQTEIAIGEADVVLFLVDKTTGVIPADVEVARLLLKAQKRTLLVINKCEDLFKTQDISTNVQISEFYKLGLGEPLPISALHGLNINELLDRTVEQLSPYYEEENAQAPLLAAIVGKPNVGKSSLLNAILGQERVIVDSAPGTTRDAIDTSFTWRNKNFVFIDTAGIRKKSRVSQPIEKYSLLRSLKAIERSSVTLLLMDAKEGLSLQDKKILAKVLEVGCGGIIVVNKWDLVKEQNKAEDLRIEEIRDRFKQEMQTQIPYLPYFPILFISALKRQGLTKLMNLVERVAFEHNRWISTGQLNKIIMEIYNKTRPPGFKGKSLKIYYATQIRTGPPCFLLFVNQPAWIKDAYLKYLQDQLRQRLGVIGTPIRILIRKR